MYVRGQVYVRFARGEWPDALLENHDVQRLGGVVCILLGPELLHCVPRQREVLEHVVAHPELGVVFCVITPSKILLCVRKRDVRYGLTFFEFLQHGFLEVVRGTSLEQQPLRECAVVERPEHVLVVREPIQREHRIEHPLELGVAHALLAVAHGLVEVFRDHLCGLVAPRAEAVLEGVAHCVYEFLVGLFPWGSGPSLGGAYRGHGDFVGEGGRQSGVDKEFEVEEVLHHVLVCGRILDNLRYLGLETTSASHCLPEWLYLQGCKA